VVYPPADLCVEALQYVPAFSITKQQRHNCQMLLVDQRGTPILPERKDAASRAHILIAASPASLRVE